MFEDDPIGDLPAATLCHLLRGAAGNVQPDDDGGPDADEALLIHKKRGVGSGQWVGPGGKVEPGETVRECVIREVREEVGIDVLDPEKVGVFVYRSDDWDAVIHVFRATEYAGTPEETEEADPRWFPVDDIPFDEMWQTDREWLPNVLDGGTFRGRFVYSDGEPQEVSLETGVTPSV
ncbi:8-oxo-dGTP diphosphatase [Halolamina salifodinae]|uniref:Oxidized purine nucleoside triphosphate hydrolase n=1 Tax=Halolamina salifodinae TaxID=1202767 RepID=A0A8T4H0V1_9EURY|nr:8-oxo-dGTP diphosphatase [Halolamina salifodinae]MBP1986958.1 8-oxo-dGTP diphosphatase [Halolamina salifodinae]